MRGNIFLCGDLNARTGSDADFIHDDNDKHILLALSYIIDTDIKKLCREDNKIDRRGKQVNDLCISSNLRVIIGRSLGALLGNLTCKIPSSASVDGYVIDSDELLKEVIYFHVHPFLPLLSDCHCKISVSLGASFTREESLKNEYMPDTF